MAGNVGVSRYVSGGGDLGAGSIVGRIDEVKIVGGERTEGQTIPRGGQISVRGWLLNRETGGTVDGLKIGIESGPSVDAMVSIPRPDVANALEWTTSVNGGFYAVIPVDSELGTHSIVATAHSGRIAMPIVSTCTFDVVNAPDPLAGLTQRNDGWAYFFDGFYAGERHVAPAVTHHTITLPLDEPSLLRLWIIDEKHRRPPALVVARLGGQFVRVFDGTERQDAADSVGVPSATLCGYDVPVLPPLTCAAPLQIYALSIDGTFLRLPRMTIRLADPLPSEFLPNDADIRTSIDDVRVGDAPIGLIGRYTVARGTPMTIRGWAVDECGVRVAGAVEAQVDRVRTFVAQPSEPRSDVAELFGSVLLADAGFALTLDTAAWPSGEHKVSLRAFAARGDRLRVFAEFIVAVEG